MKKLITLIIVSINLIALDFGKDVKVMGKWNITTGSSFPTTEFLSSINNKWLVDFRTDGYVYDIGSTKKLAEWKFKIDDVGVIHLKEIKSYSYTKNMKPEDIGYDFFYNRENQFLKIVKKINNQEGKQCFLVNIINQNQNLYMCKLESYKEQRERDKGKVIIQMK